MSDHVHDNLVPSSESNSTFVDCSMSRGHRPTFGPSLGFFEGTTSCSFSINLKSQKTHSINVIEAKNNGLFLVKLLLQ